MRNDFAIFIISHGRANSLLTVDTIIKSGYSGMYYIILDNEDEQYDDYCRIYGKNHIVVFDKSAIAKEFDIMDNFPGRQVPTYARNALHSIAKKLNLKYFLELEDDYQAFRQRYVSKDNKFRTRYVGDLDSIIDVYIEFLETSNAVTVAFCQTGDLIGGPNSAIVTNKLTRKAMNCFFCKTDRPFQCYGRFNDDVNAYINNGKRGDLFFTTRDIVMDQPQTQTRSGGITSNYLHYGTYVKTFYSVMLEPSCIKVSTMGDSLHNTHHRYHHKIDWNSAVPKIISGRYKK